MPTEPDFSAPDVALVEGTEEDEGALVELPEGAGDCVEGAELEDGDEGSELGEEDVTLGVDVGGGVAPPPRVVSEPVGGGKSAAAEMVNEATANPALLQPCSYTAKCELELYHKSAH